MFDQRLLKAASQCFVLILFNFILSAGSSLAQQPPSPLPPTERISLAHAIELGISKNPDIIVLKLEAGRAGQDAIETEGLFDTTVSLNADIGREVSPSSSTLTGSSFVEKDRTVNLSVTKRFSLGTNLELAWNNSRLENSALFTALSPEWHSQATLGLTQPLLRGAWSGRPGILVEIRKKLEQGALWDYEAELAKEVKSIVERYWEQKLAADELDVRERSLALAEKLGKDAEAGVAVGLQAPLAVSETRAQIALRKEELLNAKSRLQAAANALRRAIGEEFNEYEEAPLALEDAPKYSAVNLDVEGSVTTALSHRPEILAQEYRLKSSDLARDFASNELLPEINVVGKAGLEGLAGTPVPGLDGSSSTTFNGNFNEALDKLGSGDFYEYQAGIQFRHPLENRTARARFSKADIDRKQAYLKMDGLKRTVAIEVKNSLTELRTSAERIDAAKEALAFANKSVEAAQERYKVGLTTTREILEVQRDFSEAELSVAQALVDYENAVAEVYRARGELLERYQIVVGK